VSGITARSRRIASSTARRSSVRSNVSTSTPLTPGVTLSRAPPMAFATTGAPAAIASTGIIPKSSTAGNTNVDAAS
jgi:hypothetical protein